MMRLEIETITERGSEGCNKKARDDAETRLRVSLCKSTDVLTGPGSVPRKMTNGVSLPCAIKAMQPDSLRLVLTTKS